MSDRFVLGVRGIPWADACGLTGAELRANQTGAGPFKLSIMRAVPWSEIEEYFAEDHWPQLGHFSYIALCDDLSGASVKIEVSSLCELRAEWDQWQRTGRGLDRLV